MTVVEKEAPTPAPITDRQREVYDWIVDFCETRGYSPTLRELCRAFKFHSPNGAVCHVRPLARKGWISWQPNQPRTIRPIGGVR